MSDFEPKHEGAFLAYLRKTLVNLIHDARRNAERRPQPGLLPDDLPGHGPNPLVELMWKETLEAYDAALLQLTDKQREAFILRMELGFSYAEVAEAMDSRPDAVRRNVSRAMVRMAACMRGHEKDG